MVRQARIQSQTGYYHVMMRGNNREMIFDQTVDKEYFIEQLQYKAHKENISIVAYCLMDNHVHLLIHSDLRIMTEVLKWVNIKFAGRYNYKYKRVGHVFQGRYKSEVINSEEQLIQVIRYIHYNPVKAKLVSTASNYKWSSYKSYTENKIKLINPEEKKLIMNLFSGSIEQFKCFHLEEENNEFLELKEDLEKEREERAQIIITKYCKQYGLTEGKDINKRKDVLEEVIIELLKKTHLSHRRIAEITGTTRGTIHGIVKKRQINAKGTVPIALILIRLQGVPGNIIIYILKILSIHCNIVPISINNKKG